MVIPSIDLSGGKAVQLRQGRDKVLEREDPVSLAREFSRFGEIAVIDLDAALSRGENEALLAELCRIAECRVGGGIRSVDKARRLVARGATKVIIGTRVFKENGVDRDFLGELARAVGRDRIIIALDNVLGKVVIDGWRTQTGLDVRSIFREAEPYASEFLLTCVDREGLMAGTDLAAVRSLRSATNLALTAAGGVSCLAEIEELSALGANVQLGLALHTGALSLPDAFLAALDWEKNNGLVPTIVQDASSQVLMAAWSSPESLKKIFADSRAWYYSRTRKRLWLKGETSGNVQAFVKVRTDCDGDALLLTVRPKGAACHTGQYSCFGEEAFSLGRLYSVVQDRLENPAPGSYTASLSESGIREKIIEEAGELAAARPEDEIIWEAADVLYFVCALLAKKGIPLEDIYSELRRRRRSPRRGRPEAAPGEGT
jgi:phosphoribosyl-ATP pyrophosphohydrolase/phosphoribosyl-AMP cyclohydrolase